MRKIGVGKRACIGGKSDLRGTAYVTEAAKPFKGNGVSSTMVSGGDLRARNGQKNGGAK